MSDKKRKKSEDVTTVVVAPPNPDDRMEEEESAQMPTPPTLEDLGEERESSADEQTEPVVQDTGEQQQPEDVSAPPDEQPEPEPVGQNAGSVEDEVQDALPKEPDPVSEEVPPVPLLPEPVSSPDFYDLPNVTKLEFGFTGDGVQLRKEYEVLQTARHEGLLAIACSDGYVHFVHRDHHQMGQMGKGPCVSHRLRAELACGDLGKEYVQKLAVHYDSEAGRLYLAYAAKETVHAMSTPMGTIRWEEVSGNHACMLMANGDLFKVEAGIERLEWRRGGPKKDGPLHLFIHGKDGRIFITRERGYGERLRLVRSFWPWRYSPPWFVEEVGI